MAKKITLGIPEEDYNLLQVLGRLAVAHGNLEMVQIMCLKTLENLSPQEALEQYRHMGAGKIRQRIRDVVARKGTSAECRLKRALFELLTDARCHSKRRNAVIHRFWGRDEAGRWWTSGDGSMWENLPSITVIDDLVASIIKTTNALNRERFKGGYLFDLAKR